LEKVVFGRNDGHGLCLTFSRPPCKTGP
jgi:hypothetical protein